MSVYGASPVKRRRRTREELAAVQRAIREVLEDEHPATLRGTYYRLVSAGAVEKTEAGYSLVGREVLKMRRAGDLPYSWITDGTRYIRKPKTWGSVNRMLYNAAVSYRRALWDSQDVEVHLFTEKDAISGVVDGVTGEFDVPLGVLRGYASESFVWTVAEEVKYSDKPVVFYNLGDHDPSGVDAWRDFTEKVQRFAPDAPVTFERLAVLPEQITAWHLPTRPTKGRDTRAAGFAGGSVEVDAIPPNRLRRIVRDAIERHIDAHALRLTRVAEDSERDLLWRMARGEAST